MVIGNAIHGGTALPQWPGCSGSTHTGVIGNADGKVVLFMGVVALPWMGVVVPGP